MKKLVWIGPRESDTYYSNIDFYASIVYNGEYHDNCTALTNKLNTRINQYKNTHLKLTDYIKNEAEKFLTDETVNFMFYNPMQAYTLGEEYVKKSVCINPLYSIEFIRNKGKLRSYARDHIDIVPFVQFTGNHIPEVTFKGFDNCSFVLQKVISSGGYGTYRLTLDAVKTFLLRNPANETYILSPYIANAVPINVHVVIFDDDCIVFPPSLQILEECERHFIYIGADFHTNFSEDAYKKIIRDASILANELRCIGYRGVCGFDFMLTRDKLLFLEVNTRFQSSTFMLNRILQDEKLPSIHELNIMAFDHALCPLKSFSSIRLPKSFFTVMGKTVPSWYSDMDNELPSLISRPLRDGFRDTMSTEEDAYLYRAVTDRNLGWVNRDNQLVLAPNIRPDSIEWKHKILSGDLLALKISLLNQGVRISTSAKQQMEVTGHIRPGVFQSVDLRLSNNMVINAPYHTDFSELSPYCIDYDGKTYILTYERQMLSKISFDTIDVNGDKTASNGTIYRHASLLATDRLRVHHQFRCQFKESGKGCKFCNIKLKEGTFTISDVKEIIDFYLDNIEFRHFLIGGGSGDAISETKNILTISEYIRSKCDKPIYAMCLPPENTSVLSEYKKAGITEIGFNIEIYNREIAKEMMEGKGSIPLSRYEDAFREAVRLWGNDGNVRSMMVLGLEPLSSFYDGIQWLCEMGVMPIISIFRPMNNMVIREAFPPDNEASERIYLATLKITQRYSLIPGPLCPDCQNNTLSLPENMIKAIYTD